MPGTDLPLPDASALAPPDTHPPRKALLLGELKGIAKLGVTQLSAMIGGGIAPPDPAGKPVLLIPGFLGSPISMHALDRRLRQEGYGVWHWDAGRNYGARSDTLDRLDRIVERASETAGAPVTIIGWSLGGVFGREIAKRDPDRVRAVLTLGSPFSGDPRANNVWRIYEWIAGHPVDNPPVETVLSEKPPVPTTAFWSRNDGIVAPAAAYGAKAERDRAVELGCTHVGFVTDPGAIDLLIGYLGESD